MPRFTARFLLSPPGPFGLPDGDRVVVPVDPDGREVVGPLIDTRTCRVAAHGTLSDYRKPENAVRLRRFAGTAFNVSIKEALTAHMASTSNGDG